MGDGRWVIGEVNRKGVVWEENGKGGEEAGEGGEEVGRGGRSRRRR